MRARSCDPKKSTRNLLLSEDANENFPLDAVLGLRQAAHDVSWIRTDNPGSRDQEVVSLAIAEERISLT
jgi:hypothetical protein